MQRRCEATISVHDEGTNHNKWIYCQNPGKWRVDVDTGKGFSVIVRLCDVHTDAVTVGWNQRERLGRSSSGE